MRLRRTAVVLVGAGLAIASCGGSDDAEVAVSRVETSVPATESPVTTAAEAEVTTTTVIAATTTVEAPPTSLSEVVEDPGFGDEWAPRCQHVIPAPGIEPGGPIQDVLEEFGPLEDRPSMLIQVPTAPFAPGNGEGRDPAYVRVLAVEGGLVFGFSGTGMSNAETSMVAMVDHAGNRRWVRCLDGPLTELVSAPAGFGPEMILIGVMTAAESATIQTTRSWLSVDDGTVLGSLEDFSGTETDYRTWTVIDSSGITALIGSDVYTQLYPSEIATIDLKSGVVTDVPSFPQTVDDTAAFTPYYGVHSAGEVKAFGGGAEAIGLEAVWLDGEWRTDPKYRALAEPIRLMWLGDDELRLHGVDAAGFSLWRNDTLLAPGLEGGWISQSPEVAVLQACTDPVADGPCGHSLLGIDPNTGTELWRLPGFRNTPLGVVDGLVITNSGDVMGDDESGRHWVMLDALSGAEIPDQRWDRPQAFHQGCCGEGEYFHVHQLGGVVVTVASDQIRVWYPRGLDVPDSEVALP